MSDENGGGVVAGKGEHRIVLYLTAEEALMVRGWISRGVRLRQDEIMVGSKSGPLDAEGENPEWGKVYSLAVLWRKISESLGAAFDNQ